MKLVKPSFEILSLPDKVLETLELYGRVCYKSEERISSSSASRFCKMLLSNKHMSVIEHLSMTVRFVVDRGVSHELVRHRLCSFSQKSTRYTDDGGIFVIPPWVDLEPGTYSEMPRAEAPTAHWLQTMLDIADTYETLRNLGWTPQQARSVLPNSLATEIIVTANLREWRHIFTLRCHPSGHPQMREVMVPLLATVQQLIPVIFEELR
jgi:thymidylate synthase (FAD)